MANCNICYKRVLPHSYHIQCNNCKNLVHINCLPFVNRNDELYNKRHLSDWYCTLCSSELFPFNHILEEDEFILAISEYWTVDENVPIDDLLIQEKLFTPFDLNENENGPLFDIDPDIQFYVNQCGASLPSCDYYLENAFNKKISKLNVDDDCVSMIHLNIRSAIKNLGKFEMYLSNLKHTFPIIAISESWIKNHNVDTCNMYGYQSEHNYRPNKGGGGVSLFIKNGIEYTLRHDLKIQNSSMETLFIEIKSGQIGNKNDMIVGVIYRPPDTEVDYFNDLLSNTLSEIKGEKKSTYLLGDFNINLLNGDKHVHTQDFLDAMYTHCLFPYINKPSRVTIRSATLIDNIFSNETPGKADIFAGILYTDISDHFPVFYIDHSSKKTSNEILLKKRIFSENNITAFCQKTSENDWSNIYNCSDAQIAYTYFYNDISRIYNTCFPLRSYKPGYKTRKSWLTEGLRQSIKLKNKMYRKSLKSKNPELESNYKKYRNRLNKLLHIAEREHYNQLILNTKNNLKKSWQILKEIINKKKSSGCSSRFLVNNKIITNKIDICNGFNTFFINIGPTLARKIPDTGKSPLIFMKNRVFDSMYVNEVTLEELHSVIKNLKESSPGWDQISAKVVKSTYNNFKTPLLHVLNLSLLNGVFPSELKVARVIPLYKAGDSLLFSNYRPVSVLPLFSKVLERLMYNRLLSFVNEHKILYSFQFGFRIGHSPSLALIYLVDKISSALEDGEFVLGLFLDFSKAFDTVNHSILYEKLEYYGVRGIALDWFMSYLTKREQFVEYNGATSERQVISCGVPQGSILGPLLFLLYINDLAFVSDKLFALLFADDSNLFISGKNLNNLISTMNCEMIKVIEWLRVNKLSLNLKKTHFMIFRRKRRKIAIEEDLIVDGVRISVVDKTKFLGVVIDEYLTFEYHVKHVRGKVARGLGILYKGRRLLNKTSLLQLYNSFMYPYINYCICVWGNTCMTYLSPLIILQKKAVRMISGAKRLDHTDSLFKELRILRITEVFAYSIQLVIFKYHHGLLPDIFRHFFTFNSTIHNYNTRQVECMHVPLMKSKQATLTVRSVGVRSYNHFNGLIDINCLELSYKYNLKTYILENGCSYLSVR